MNRQILRSVVPVALAFSCIGLTAFPPPVTAKTTIQFWINHTPQEEEQFKQLVVQFEAEHPGISVQVINTGAGYYDKVKTAIAGGVGPDVFYVRPGTDRFFLKDGMAKSLDALVRRDARELNVNDFIDAQRAELTYKGAWWALPYDYSVIGLFYARHLFDRAGVGYPDESWTWTDLARAARKLTVTTGDGKVSQWGMLSLWGYMSQWFEGFVMTHGGRVFNEESTRAVVNNPNAIQALRVPYALINEVHAAPKPSNVDVWGSFLKGLGAMTLAGSWDTLTIRNSVDFEFDVAMLPKAENHDRVVSATGGAWAMSAATKYQDQAWELIKFLASPLVARKLIVEPTRSLPPRKSLMRPWADRIGSTGDAPAHALALGDQAVRFGRNVPVLDFNAGSIHSKYGSALFAGSISPEEAAIRMEHDLNVEFDRLRGQ